jgi:uncharacterized protein (TIGR03437 family)
MTKIGMSTFMKNYPGLGLICVGVLSIASPSWAQTYTISPFAGGGNPAGTNGDGGPASMASFAGPIDGIAIAPNGNVYISESQGNVVRLISKNGIISTVAGTGLPGYLGDGGPAVSARLNGPSGLAVDAAGNLYIADGSSVRKVSPDGTITTFAGTGSFSGDPGDGGPATSALLQAPFGLAFDANGNLYISDQYANNVRKVSPNGVITTVAGTGSGGTLGDGGPALSAQLLSPESIAIDGAGNLYIADFGNNRVRKVSTNGIITTVAGTGGFGYLGDGGPATGAQFYYISAVAIDPSGNLLIADENNSRVRRVTSDGNIATIAGDGVAGFVFKSSPATSASLYAPSALAVGGNGTVYIGDGGGAYILVPTTSVGSPPSITSAVNAFSNASTIAPNTWVAIKGSNLAPSGDSRIWQGSDFVSSQMPTALDGVSVTMNGENAYVYYISPTQLNILTPPDLASGTVQVQVAVGGQTSASFTVQTQANSLAFFVFNGGPYVVGGHLNGSIVGPTTLFPGASTPAQAGEEVVLYANGFGPTSSPIAKGSSIQAGTLTPTPVIQIGGTPATVKFAGLVSPGLYQFNVIVPSTASSGDNPLTVMYKGQSTQTGVLLTVQ